MNYRDFRKYIKNVSLDEIDEYSQQKSAYDNELSGQRQKRFIRLSSDVFGELIDELKNNPNCAYKTYINDLVKEGYVPKAVSVIIKDENELRKIINDVAKLAGKEVSKEQFEKAQSVYPYTVCCYFAAGFVLGAGLLRKRHR